MKTDVNGCSTTAAGQEQYEEYYDNIMRGIRVQYDYRTPQGKLFSCVAKSLEAARARRDAWLVKQSAQSEGASDMSTKTKRAPASKGVNTNKAKPRVVESPAPVRRTWQWRAPVDGMIRTSRIVATSQRLHAEGVIVFPMSWESLRAWANGDRKSDDFPVARADMRPFGKTFLYPAGSDYVIAFWYDGRQRREDESVWRARLEKYLAAHPQEEKGNDNAPA